jgi:transposase-like protein
MKRAVPQGIGLAWSAAGWRLSGVLPRPADALADVVAGFTATHEAGWLVTGELARQDGRLIVRSFKLQPVRLAQTAALQAIARSRTLAPGTVQTAFFSDDVRDAETPAGGVTAQVTRSIPFGDLLANVLVAVLGMEQVYGMPDEGPEPEPWEIARRGARQAQELLALAHNAGRPAYGDDFYRRIAARCLAIQAEHPGDGVIKKLAQLEGASYETARSWVRKARSEKYQMLAPGSPGRSGFEAGQRFHATKGEASK